MMDYNGMSQHKKLIQFIDGCERIAGSWKGEGGAVKMMLTQSG